MTIHNLELLEKLAQIYSWDRECCYSIRKIALRTPEKFGINIGQILSMLLQTKSDEPLPTAQNDLDDLCYRVYEIAVYSDPIRELLCSDPALSEADAEQVIDYACIADVTPDPDPAVMLSSKDALFMKLLRRILKQFPITPKDIFQENLANLIALHLEYPILSKQLGELAKLYDWSEILRSLQGILVKEEIPAERLEHLPEAAKSFIDLVLDQEKNNSNLDEESISMEETNTMQAMQSIPMQSKPSVREFLLGELGIVGIQRREVLLFQQIETEVEEIYNDIQQTSWEAFSSKQKGEALARAFLERKEIPKDLSQLILNRIDRRIEAAKHYISLREFVKFHALNQSWPELSAELVYNRGRFLAFESRMLDIDTLGKEASGSGELARLLQRYRTNDQLLRFLKLRPYFNGLSVQKAEELHQLTTAMPQTEPEKTPQPTSVSPQASLVAPTVSVLSSESEAYTNIYITISRSDDQSLEDPDFTCKISAKIADLSSAQLDTTIIVRRQDIESIKNNAHNLMRIPYAYSGSRSPVGVQTDQRMPASEPPKRQLLSTYLKEIGLQLSSLFFTNELAEFIIKAFNSHTKIRLALEIKIPEFISLPWECLYIGELNLPVALVSKHSLVRHFPSSRRILSHAWGAKLRILMLFSSPKDQAPLQLEEEEKVLRDVFANFGRVDVAVIKHANIDEFSHQIRRFKPHIIHFSGHGGLVEATGEGALIFEREERKAQYLYASQFSMFCRDQNVSMVVLNACDTGTPVANDAVTSVAGALVEAGIPATIATTRTIYDIQSIMFVREFYRAIVDGYPIESAMAEARKRVNSEDWDWSAFALFVSTLDLERYSLIFERS